MNKTTVVFIGLLLLTIFQIKAQVTIGSAIKPASGALLQLKEFEPSHPDSGGANATRGLMLPRVELKSMLNLDDIDGADMAEKDNYTGLMVYNVGNNLCENLFSGVYMWSGDEWKGLNVQAGGIEAGTLIDDRAGSPQQTYRIASFSDAGTWMLENLRAISYADGTSIDFSASPKSVAESTAFYINPGYNASRVAAEGYHYSGRAALKGEIIAGAYESAPASAPDRILQGVCPDGWRIPTYEDWIRLFEFIKNDESCSFSTTVSNPANSNGALIRPGSENIDYTSRLAKYQGFYAYPTGANYWTGEQNAEIKNYPAFATTFPSKATLSGVNYRTYSPMYFSASQHATQILSSESTTVAVRCVKDDVADRPAPMNY